MWINTVGQKKITQNIESKRETENWSSAVPLLEGYPLKLDALLS